MTKKNDQPLGISPYALALVEQDTDILQADRPSYYAEAMLGVKPRQEISHNLDLLVESINSGSANLDKIPSFMEFFTSNFGDIDITDLETILRKSRKKSASLINTQAVDTGSISVQGTLSAKVKSRGSAVKQETLRYWNVEMADFEFSNGHNQGYTRQSQAPPSNKLINRRRLWVEDNQANINSLERLLLQEIKKSNPDFEFDTYKNLHLADYAETCLLTEMALKNAKGVPSHVKSSQNFNIQIPFNFSNRWDLVFEAFVRRYNDKENYYSIDEFLLGQNIISKSYEKLLESGKVSIEVIKHQRHFESLGVNILMQLHQKLTIKGYEFSGFSREFINIGNKHKDYQTIGLVYENPNVPERSIRVVYDNNFYIPFVIDKQFSVGENIRLKGKYKNSPVRLFVQNKTWAEIDDRTRQRCVYTINPPSGNVLKEIPGAKKLYDNYLRQFRK